MNECITWLWLKLIYVKAWSIWRPYIYICIPLLYSHQTISVQIKENDACTFDCYPGMRNKKQKRSTEGCSNFKSPETRQVQERLVSSLVHMQVPKWDRTRYPEEWASSVGMPHPLHMFYGNLAQLGKKSNSVIRSISVTVKNWCYVLSMKGVTVCGHHPECRVTFRRGGGGGLILFCKIPVPTIELP